VGSDARYVQVRVWLKRDADKVNIRLAKEAVLKAGGNVRAELSFK